MVCQDHVSATGEVCASTRVELKVQGTALNICQESFAEAKRISASNERFALLLQLPQRGACAPISGREGGVWTYLDGTEGARRSTEHLASFT